MIFINIFIPGRNRFAQVLLMLSTGKADNRQILKEEWYAGVLF